MGKLGELHGTSLKPLGVLGGGPNKGGFAVGKNGTLNFDPTAEEPEIKDLDIPAVTAAGHSSDGRAIASGVSDKSSGALVNILEWKRNETN